MSKKLKAMIFGSNGQDGHYLRKLLEREQIECIGISRNGNAVIGDVSNREFVEEQMKRHLPTHVFHLAANSTTRHNVLFENHETISTGTLNILESVRVHAPQAKVFISGSAMQFKMNGLPINEQTPFDGSSPYSVARIQSVYAARYYRNKFGMNTYVGYFFNHDSPLRSEQHVNQKIVQAVKRIQSGSKEKLEIGNIDVKKEFSYAGDIMEAVWMLVNQTTVHEAVIGSGKAYSIREWMEYCFNKIGKNWNDHVVIKEGFVPEYDILISEPSLIKSLGWEQKVDFHQLAEMMMEESFVLNNGIK